ncbi:MAG TPA: efflux RND transporter periplasmic adaptor subunit [Vicinamibacterales bacterium]
MKRAITVFLFVAAIGAVAGAYYFKRGGNEPQVNTAPITRGDIVDTVGATGTLQAVTTVQVGSQVSGNISWLGADFNSIVKKGQVIARLDPSLFEAQLQQAKATLGQAEASLAKAQSDLERAKVMLVDAQQKYTRTKELADRQLMPQSDLDAAKIAVDSAQATLASQQATLAQSQAAVKQAEASVNQNQVNVDHTIIEAPIDGIVTQRSVDVGQTVAASMQAPTLFIIAADLTKMQVNASIDEADVGRIRPGQNVTFRVDAYPTEDFRGTVSQIRLQPVVVQNVTTYGTVIDVPNAELKLKPGMTANVKVEINKKADVLRVPNTALRFRPTSEMFSALNQAVPPEVQFAGRGSKGSGGSSGARGAQSAGAPALTPPAPAASAQPAQEGGGGDPKERQARMMERFKAMSADEQKQFIARTKDRGIDTSEFEKIAAPPGGKKSAGKPNAKPAETIDALFAPLPAVESRGRAWLFVEHQLKSVSLRLGITDGTNTELLSGDLDQTSEVVTGITGVGSTRTTSSGGTGNPLMPGGRGPGGFGGGGGRGGR